MKPPDQPSETPQIDEAGFLYRKCSRELLTELESSHRVGEIHDLLAAAIREGITIGLKISAPDCAKLPAPPRAEAVLRKFAPEFAEYLPPDPMAETRKK